MKHSQNTHEIIKKWQQYLITIENWKNLVTHTTPKECGCGLVYELPQIAHSKDESFAIADMRKLKISEPHYHPELEIYFILQGSGLVVVGNSTHIVTKNSVIVIPSSIAHYTIPQHDLVMAVINTPPFNNQNYVPLIDDNTQVQFSKRQFDSHATSRFNLFKDHQKIFQLPETPGDLS